MRYGKAIALAVVLVAALTAPALAAGPVGAGFPLDKGTKWVYEGPVRDSTAGSDDVTDKVLTWNMEVLETIQRQHVWAAVVKGHPLDLAMYEEGKTHPGTYLIVRVGEDQYYLLTEERVQDALNRLKDEDDVLTDLVKDSDLFLDLPLAPGKVFGDTFQVTRQDSRYYWYVASQGPALLDDIKGVDPAAGLTQYELSFTTLPDDTQVTFTPGLGFIRYVYNHHGSPAWMDLKLVEYRSPQVRLTVADAGKTIELEQGGALTIALAANPTTGYTWEVAAGDEHIIRLEGEPDYQAESAAIGAGGVMTLHFRTGNPGQTILKLVYHRPWEKDQPPAETFEVSIAVK